MGYAIPKACAVCGATLDYDLDEGLQRVYELHLRACQLFVLVEIEKRLSEICDVLETRLVPALAEDRR